MDHNDTPWNMLKGNNLPLLYMYLYEVSYLLKKCHFMNIMIGEIRKKNLRNVIHSEAN